jgi:hypothetical protein
VEAILPGAQHRKDREVCNDIENDKIVKSENKKLNDGKNKCMER